jgi:hypothetical protein
VDVTHLIARYPQLHHMAQAGSWQSILANGLLSPVAVANRLGLAGSDRARVTCQHRPANLRLDMPSPGRGAFTVVLRDQIPMNAQRLAGVLDHGLTPQQWYEIINSKVFFWAQPERLGGLLSAKSYRHHEHDVFTFDTASLVNQHACDIWLCAINSGSVSRFPARRGLHTFKRIADYPTTSTGRPVREVVELVVDYSVPNIARHVVQVRRMKGAEIIQTLYSRD